MIDACRMKACQRCADVAPTCRHPATQRAANTANSTARLPAIRLGNEIAAIQYAAPADSPRRPVAGTGKPFCRKCHKQPPLGETHARAPRLPRQVAILRRQRAIQSTAAIVPQAPTAAYGALVMNHAAPRPRGRLLHEFSALELQNAGSNNIGAVMRRCIAKHRRDQPAWRRCDISVRWPPSIVILLSASLCHTASTHRLAASVFCASQP